MRRIAALLAIAGVGLTLHGFLGAFTTAGRQTYDEMDGMIPLAAFVAGSTLLAVAALLWLIGRRWRR